MSQEPAFLTKTGFTFRKTDMRGGSLIGKEPIRQIVLMENHQQAFFVWQKKRVKNRILIHIDAHLDFGWIPEKEMYKVLLANDLTERSLALGEKMFWHLREKEKMKIVNTGNYLYPALKNGIISKIYWVVPDKIWNDPEERGIIKKIFSQIQGKHTKEKVTKNFLQKKSIVRTICHRKFITCKLANLPTIDESVLLDIDIDYFLINSRLKEMAGITTEKEKPWIWPKDLILSLKNKGIRADCVTISYSVEEGFTPLKYKYLGNQLANLLRKSNVCL